MHTFRRAFPLVLAVALLVVASPTTDAQLLSTIPLSGAEQVPPNGSAATGTACMVLTPATQTLSWEISWSGMTPTAAHFHGPANPGQNAGVMIGIPLNGNPATGSTQVTQQQINTLIGGDSYINIHSGAFPGGEIRGQVQFSTLWGHWGGGAPGAFGTPNLLGCGLLQPGTPAKIDLTNVPPSTLLLGMISTTNIAPNAFFGGTLHPAPPPLGSHLFFASSPVGTFSATVPWPAGIPPNTVIWIQFLVQDATVPPDGVSMSNALRLVTP